MSVINVYKIKYEIRSNQAYPDWECCIMAKNQDDALQHLKDHIKAPFVVTTIEYCCRIDSISNPMKEMLFPKKNKKEGVICPHCNKHFKSPHALSIHITKAHPEVEK